MEGIMMRGPEKYALAVRNPQGEMVLEEYENKAAKRPAFCRWPVIRGLFGYIDSMKLGYTCLMRSAEISGLDDLVEESPRKKKKRLLPLSRKRNCPRPLKCKKFPPRRLPKRKRIRCRHG